jgi:hypothetical protein
VRTIFYIILALLSGPIATLGTSGQTADPCTDSQSVPWSLRDAAHGGESRWSLADVIAILARWRPSISLTLGAGQGLRMLPTDSWILGSDGYRVQRPLEPACGADSPQYGPRGGGKSSLEALVGRARPQSSRPLPHCLAREPRRYPHFERPSAAACARANSRSGPPWWHRMVSVLRGVTFPALVMRAGARQEPRFCNGPRRRRPHQVPGVNVNSDVRTCSPATTHPRTRSAGGWVVRRGGARSAAREGAQCNQPERLDRRIHRAMLAGLGLSVGVIMSGAIRRSRSSLAVRVDRRWFKDRRIAVACGASVLTVCCTAVGS